MDGALGADGRPRSGLQQPARKGTGLLLEVRPEVGGRDLDPKEARSVLPAAQVTDERQERSHLSAGVREVDALDVPAAPVGPEALHRLQVVAPIAAADDVPGE